MSRRFRKILGIAALLGLVFLTGFFINAFYGNPVSALLARNTARQVLEEQFPGEPYTVESCGYNLKNGCYTVRVSREGSMDDWFDIDVEPDGTFRSHDYADRVPNCRNTWNRLSQDYYNLGKTVMELPDFPGLPAKDFPEVQDFPDSAEVQVTAASRRTVKMFMPISM